MAKAGHRAWGTVRKRASGRWQASYIGPDGHRHSGETTYSVKSNAEGWLANERKLIERGEWTSPEERKRAAIAEQAAGITFGDYAANWLETRTVKGSPLARRTREHYGNLLNRHIYPDFKTTPLRDIDMTMVDQWYVRTLVSAPTMRSHAYSLFKTILETARTRDRLIEGNPCMIRGAGAVARAGVTVVATVDQLVAVVGAMPEDLRLMVLLAGWTALRAGELVELRRNDIELTDDEVGVIRVRRGAARVKGGWIVDGPKSNAGIRDVDIPPHVIPAVREHLKRFTAPGDSLLFPPRSPDPSGRRRLQPSTFNRHYDKARKAAGRPDLRLHDLRHTGGTLAAQTGATLAELMARLGHSSPQAAMRYQHAAQGRGKVIADALSRIAMGK